MPDLGHKWPGWDWDQIELRIATAEAKDRVFLEAFREKYDIHTLNACDLFGLPYPPNKRDPHKSSECAEWRAQVQWDGKEDERRVFAKRFVYRLLYGGDPGRADDIPGAKALGLDGRKIVIASNRFLAAHPDLARWHREVRDTVDRAGMVRTWSGRRRVFLSGGNEAVRAAFDQPMQGGTSDIYNLTIIEVTAKLGDVLTFAYGMHDSQWWDCDGVNLTPDLLRRLRAIVEQERNVNGVSVPFPATMKIMDETGKVTEWKE